MPRRRFPIVQTGMVRVRQGIHQGSKTTLGLRDHETHAGIELCQACFRQGRVPASRPQFSRASYRKDFVRPSTILSGFEPLFDSAGVIQCRCSPLRLSDLRGRPRRHGHRATAYGHGRPEALDVYYAAVRRVVPAATAAV